MAVNLHFPFDHINILYITAVALDAKTIVELGTGTGDSGEAFGEAIEITGGRVYSVDIAECLEAKNRLKGHRITFIGADSIECGRTWDKGDIDVLLCDSDHSFKRVYGELTVWSKWHPKIIFIHDTLSPDCKITPPYNAALEFSKKAGKKFLNFSFPHGLGVILG